VSEPTPPPEALTIAVSRPADGVVLVALGGEVDILSVGDLKRCVADLESSMPAHVVFDLSGLSFIDSSGINALVQSVRAIELEGGTGVLAAPSVEARRVFEIIGLAQVVSVVQSLDAALRPPPEQPPNVADGAP
jgi:stage II sporulation protein AA (anti-sigma F factor antagonist)